MKPWIKKVTLAVLAGVFTFFASADINDPPCTGVSITGNPSSQTKCTGNSVNFSVGASGSDPISYQWYKNGQPVSNGGNVSGATSPTLTINNLGVGDNNSTFYAIVQNNCPSSAQSSTATLTVNLSTSISTHPQNQSVCAGSPATFSVTATGTSLTYLWKVSVDGGSTWNNAPGNNTSLNYTISSTSISDNNKRYRVVVTGTCGSLTSSSATLTVTTATTVSLTGTYDIWMSGAGVSICNGYYTFHHTAAYPSYGFPECTFDKDDGSAVIATQEGDWVIYQLPDWDTPYYLNLTASSIWDLYGSAWQGYPAPYPTAIPARRICGGSTATFTITTTGTVNGITWKESTDNGASWHNAPAPRNGSSYTTPVSYSSDTGKRYKAVVSTPCGDVNSLGIYLQVDEPVQLELSNVYDIVMVGAKLDVANGYYDIAYLTSYPYFYFHKAENDDDATVIYDDGGWCVFDEGNATKLYFNDVFAGNYWNLFGVEWYGNVANLPYPTSYLGQKICEGESALLEVWASGSVLSFQWEQSTDGGLTWHNAPGASTATSYNTPVTTSDNDGDLYRVAVTGPCGTVTSLTIYLHVLSPVRATGPASDGGLPGETVTLRVDTEGTGPFSYIWKHDGQVISGETEDTLVISGFSIDLAGEYSVVVSGQCGSVDANSALIPVKRVITYGENTTFSYTSSGLPSPTFVWKKNGQVIAGATSSSYSLTKPAVAESGSVYEVTVTGSGQTRKRSFVLTVNRKSLTITAQPASRTYGQSNPTFTYQINTSDFVTGENSSVLTGQPVVGTAAQPNSSVSGSPYPIVILQGTLLAANYKFNFVNGLLTINKANLSVTANSQTKLQGDANPPLTGTITGIQNSDPITADYTTTVTQSTVAGVYNDSITPAFVDPAGRLGNYNTTITKGNFTVNSPGVTIDLPAGGVLDYMLGRPPTPLDPKATISGTFGASYFDNKKFKAWFLASKDKDYLSVRNFRKDGEAVMDNFNRADADSLGSKWSEVQGDQDIVSSQLSLQTGSSANNLCIYSGGPCATVNQYVSVRIPTASTTGGNPYPYVVLRYTDSSSGHYRVVFQVAEDLVKWYYHANASAAGTQVGSASLGIAAGDKFGVTITGTGTSTVIRVWKNPLASTPVSATEWDSADTTADASFTQDPATAVNTGSYVGLGGTAGQAGGITLDSFFAGDIPVAGTATEVRVSTTVNGDGSRNINYGPTVIGTCKGGTPADPLLIIFNANATEPIVEAVLENICYFNTSTTPSESTRKVNLAALNQSDAPISTTKTFTINANCPGPNAIDVVVVIDKTTSMTDNTDVTPIASTDNFNRANDDKLGASWTEVQGDQDIASNQLGLQTAGSADNLCIYSGTPINTINQYACVTIPIASTTGGNPYPAVVLRYSDASAGHYRIVFQIAEDLVKWYYHANASAAGVQVASTTLASAAGDKFGVTITGLGNSTVIRIWKNPTANTPVSATEWDSGDTTPDASFTQDPATAVDAGNFVGLGGTTGQAGGVAFDNFFAGDLSPIQRLEAAKGAAKLFLNYLNFAATDPSDYAELVSFCGEPGTTTNPTRDTTFVKDRNTLINAISALTPNQQTVYHPSLILARSDLSSIIDTQRLQLIVFLTDGEITGVNPTLYKTLALEEADRIRLAGIRLITIGLGNSISGAGGAEPRDVLTRMASSPDDFWMPTALNPLTKLYGDVANTICHDSDANHAPVLTRVNTLTGGRENIGFPISYEYLLANSDAFDEDGDPIYFRIQSVTTGTLTKSGLPVVPGTTLLGSGESLSWKPALNASGPALNAFKVLAWDGKDLSVPPEVQVTVQVAMANNPPIVNAGPDLEAPKNREVTLAGTVTDADARILTTPVVSWRRLSGPNDVLFGNANQANTTVTFQSSGHYVLQLSAYDGQFTTSDEVEVEVCAERKVPLDVIFMLDVSGSMHENIGDADDAIHTLIGKMHFTGDELTSDKVGYVPITEEDTCEKLPLTSNPALVDDYLNVLGGAEFFDPAFRWGIKDFRRDMQTTREAKPVMIVISDFEITVWDWEDGDENDEAHQRLLNAAQLAKNTGIRVITVGFNLYGSDDDPSSRRYWWKELASPGIENRYEADDITQLAEVMDTISTHDCESVDTPFCLFTYQDKAVTYNAAGVNFDLSDRALNLGSAQFDGLATFTWEVISQPKPGITFGFTRNPTTHVTAVSISKPSLPTDIQGDYVLALKLSIAGTVVASDRVNIHVGTVANQPPDGRCDVFTVVEDSVNNVFDVLRNDSDPDGDSLYIVPNPSNPYPSFHGIVEIAGDQKSLKYTPDPNYNGSYYEERFTYLVADRSNPADPARLMTQVQVHVIVTPVDDPIVANADVFSVPRDAVGQPLTVLANDVNPDTDETRPGPALRITSVSALTRVGGGNPGTLQALSGNDTELYYTAASGAVSDYDVTFNYTASDPHGNTATASATVHVMLHPEYPPVAVADSFTVWTGTSPELPVLDNDYDPNGDSFYISWVSDATHLQNNGASLTFVPGALPPGVYTYTYIITDSTSRGSTPAQIQVRLTPPGPPPEVEDDKASVERNSNISIPVLSNDSGFGLTFTASDISNPAHGTAVKNGNEIRYTPTTTYYGPDSFTYTVTDPAGRRDTATVTITVYRTDGPNPIAILTKPTLSTQDQQSLLATGADPDPVDSIRDGMFLATGTADDPDTLNAFRYEIEVYSVETDNLVGTYKGNTRVPTATPAGLLGRVDLRSVPDGAYMVYLTVFGGNKTAYDSKKILLESNHKVGNLRFSDTDIKLNVASVPVSLVRSYDSVRARGGLGNDYGPGWSFELSDLNVEIDETRETITDDDGVPFSRRSGGGRNVTLTLPDGRRATFAFKPRYSPQGLLAKYYAEWQPVTPGVTATLQLPLVDSEYVIAGVAGFEPVWQRNGQCSVEKYDLPGFVLSMSDGTVYHIGREDLGEHDYALSSIDDADIYVHAYGKARVTQVDLPNGDRYYFFRDGMDHQAAGQTKSVPVLRLDRDRTTGFIKAVHDRNSIDPSTGAILPNRAPAVVYEYKDGHLYRVNKLRDRNDLTGANPKYDTITYVCDAPDPGQDHLITTVIGPRNVPLTKTSYDDEGRLDKLETPDGRWLQYHYDDAPLEGGASRRRTVDSEGNSAIEELDSRGNVLLHIDQKQSRTVRTFDALNGNTSEALAGSAGLPLLQSADQILYYGDSSEIQRILSIDSPAGQKPDRMVQEYDTRGRLKRRIDVKYTDITSVAQTPDPDFWMEYEYDDEDATDGSTTTQPTRTLAKWKSPAKTVVLTEISYYPSGHMFSGFVREAKDAVGSISSVEYYDGIAPGGRFGDVKSTTVREANGLEISQVAYRYDSNGNRTHEIHRKKQASVWVDYATTETVYDAQSREVESIDAEGGHTYTVYDADGNVESSTDRYGVTTRFMYDALGDLIQTEFAEVNDSAAHSISRQAVYYASFDFGGGVSHEVRHEVKEDPHFPGDPVNGTRTIFDESNRPIRVQRLKGIVITLTPDVGGIVQKATFNESTSSVVSETQTKYDALNRISLAADANGKWKKTEYDDKGRVWRTKMFVNPDGTDIANTTMTSLDGYDESDRPLWKLDPNQYAELAASAPSVLAGSPWDVHVALYGDTTPSSYRSRLTHVEFDEFGRVTRTYYPSIGMSAAHTDSKFDDGGNQWLTIDADGNATAYVYDALSRLAWVITDVDVVPTPPTGLPSTLPTTHAGWVSWARGDRAASDSTATHYEYDEVGRLAIQTDGNQRSTTFSYDKLNRRTSRTLPDTTSVENWTHDYTSPGSGPKVNKLRYRDFAGRYILTVSDVMGRATSRQPDGQDGGVTPLPTAAKRGAMFTYTATGLRATMTDGSVAAGNQRVTKYAYDELNRLRVQQAPEATLYYAYNAGGDVTEISATRTYTGFSGPTPAVFDPNALSAVWTRAGGAHMQYGYDARGRLEQVDSDAWGTSASHYLYDVAGNVKSVGYGNGLVTSYEYNARHQLRYLRTQMATTTRASFDYDDYDSSDGLTWPTQRRLRLSGFRQGVAELITFGGVDNRRLKAYDYDPLGRLQAERIRTSTGASWPTWPSATLPATPTSGDILYDVTPGYADAGYDQAGNRASRNSVGVNIIVDTSLSPSGIATLANQSSLSYDSDNRLNYSGSPATYDPNGNATYQAGYISQLTPGEIRPNGAVPDEYDFENRLIRRRNGTVEVTFVYDGDGNRVAKTIVGGSTTKFLVDNINPTGHAQVLEEQDASNNPTVTYIYGLDLCSQNRGGTVRYYGYDGHGTVRYLSNESGDLTDMYSYDAFGIMTGTDSFGTPTVNNYRYAGEQWDPELGMYYLRARYYKPDVGRFWTMDTFEGTEMDPLSLHLYLYAQANPVMGNDPEGHEFTLVGMMCSIAINAWTTVKFFLACYNAYCRAESILNTIQDLAFIVEAFTEDVEDGWDEFVDWLYGIMLNRVVQAVIVAVVSIAISMVVGGGGGTVAASVVGVAGKKITKRIVSKAGIKRLFGVKNKIKKKFANTVNKKTGIKFDKHGEPDFSGNLCPGQANNVVFKGGWSRHGADITAANNAWKAANPGKALPKGYIWHHKHDLKTLQFVDKKIHGATHHWGGASLQKALTGKKYR